MKIQNVQNAGGSPGIFIKSSAPGEKEEKKTVSQTGFLQEPLTVTISEEGYRCCRGSLKALEGYTPQKYDPDRPEKINQYAGFREEHLVGGDTQDRMLRALNGRFYKMTEDSPDEADHYVSKAFQAYTELYDEISKGYESGERELWRVEKVNGESKLRKLTREEELGALDAAYEKLSESIEYHFTVEKPRWEENDLLMAETVADIKRRHNMDADEQLDIMDDLLRSQSRRKKMKDISDALMLGRTMFKGSYSSDQDQEAFLKGVSKIMGKLSVERGNEEQ